MTTSTSRPQRVEISHNNFRQRVATINIDIKELEGDAGFEYDPVTIPPGKYNYEGVVDTLITHKYPSDKMQAVINNYLASPKAADAKEEFLQMQAWRTEAKAIARELFPAE